jgi:hypothetical protein
LITFGTDASKTTVINSTLENVPAQLFL